VSPECGRELVEGAKASFGGRGGFT
jgi:hypothetical protein